MFVCVCVCVCISVCVCSVSGFEFTCETGLFDLVGVPLYHGWVEDPQNSHYYQAVRNLSYNQLVEKIITDTSSDDQDRVQEGGRGQWKLNLLRWEGLGNWKRNYSICVVIVIVAAVDCLKYCNEIIIVRCKFSAQQYFKIFLHKNSILC